MSVISVQSKQAIGCVMKKLKLLAAAATLSMMMAPGQVFAESATFSASATILEALSLTKNADLSFASIIPSSSTAGTVVVSPASARTCGAGLTCSGAVSAADFTVAGADGASYALTLPGSANIAFGANTMLVDNFTTSLIGATGTLSGGSDSFQLGASLNVGAAQVAGAYTGSFTVTVEYN